MNKMQRRRRQQQQQLYANKKKRMQIAIRHMAAVALLNLHTQI
jgi:hypothetical protein